MFKTKAEVINVLKKFGRIDLLEHTVSCNRLHSIPLAFGHCGICPSCISRRIALLAAGCGPEQKYSFYYDILAEPDLSTQQKEMIQTMIKEMIFFINQRSSAFCRLWEDEINTLEETVSMDKYYPNVTKKIYDLFGRHFNDMKKAISLMWNEYDSPWSLNKGGSFFSVLKETNGYMLELQTRKICEPQVDYSSVNAPEGSAVLSHIPARGLKMKIIEKCFELIERQEITAKLSDKVISEKLIKELKQEFILTTGNETSIMDYFRKGDIEIQNINGELTIFNKNKPVKRQNSGR